VWPWLLRGRQCQLASSSFDSVVRVIDVFVDELDLSGLGFKAVAEATGRPGYHPTVMLKLYIYGYLNRIQSSRRDLSVGPSDFRWELIASEFTTSARSRTLSGRFGLVEETGG
jgi:transposase